MEGKNKFLLNFKHCPPNIWMNLYQAEEPRSLNKLFLVKAGWESVTFIMKAQWLMTRWMLPLTELLQNKIPLTEYFLSIYSWRTIFIHLTWDSIKKQFLNPVTAIQKTLIIRANITQNTLTHNYTTQTLEFQRNRQIKERIWLVFYVWIVSQLVAKSELWKEMCVLGRRKKKRKNL